MGEKVAKNICHFIGKPFVLLVLSTSITVSGKGRTRMGSVEGPLLKGELNDLTFC